MNININGIRDGRFHLLALDPGGMTGWTHFEQKVLITPQGRIEWLDKYKIEHGEFGPEPHHHQLYRFLELRRHHNWRVVCESFQNRGMDKSIISAEYIGVVRALQQESEELVVYRNRPWLFWQTASTVKGKDAFWTDDKLRKLGYWWPGEPHARDSFKHLLHHLTYTIGDNRWLKMLR
jgi:hypothetical protein